MYDNKNTVALWKKQSKAGNDYYSGYLNIDGIDYEITLFDNNTGNEKAPVLKGKVKLKEEKPKEHNEEQQLKENKTNDDAFIEFGDTIELEDSDIAF